MYLFLALLKSCEGVYFLYHLIKLLITLHSPQDSSDRDNVEVYTDEGFARQNNLTFSPASFLFIAILCGGDYDPVCHF